jgi:hypothetical protein
MGDAILRARTLGQLEMGKTVGGASLILLALLMVYGFMRSDLSLTAPATIGALLITVGLPAFGGLALLTGRFRGGRRLDERREQLRQQTIESELLRLAGERGGKLTVVEAVRDLALTPEAATQAFNALHAKELAEIEVTDAGVLVYSFHDLQRLGDKARSKNILDA